MKISNTSINGSLDWINNIPDDNRKTKKPITENKDMQSNATERNRESASSKAAKNAPENAVKDFITSFGFKQTLVQLSSKTFSLNQILNQLRGSDGLGNSLFHTKRPFSGNTNVLQIRSFNLASLKGADISNLSVDVQQVAQAQKNEGKAMNANALATEEGFTEGSHHISMNVNGREVDIKFEVSANDSVGDVQRKIANAINNSNTDVRASVSIDDETGRSSLVIESKETGTDIEGQPNFTFRSIRGNAVEVSGIDNTSKEAQNALYRVNRGFHSVGELRSSKSNIVDIGFGISVQLFGTGRAQITMGRDDNVQFNTIRDMAGLFNDLIAFGKDSEHGDYIVQELSAIAQESSSILSRIGISLDQDGFMRIDEDKLRAASSNGMLEQFALKDGTDFITSLARLLENIDKNPMAFFGAESPLLDILH